MVKIKIRTSLLLLSFLAFFSSSALFAQHVTTLEEVLLSGNANAIVHTLKTVSFHNVKLFEVRVKLIRALGKKANSNNQGVKDALVQTLGEGTVRVAKINNKSLEYWKVRAESALSLAKIGYVAAIPQIIKISLNDPDLQVRICAIRALGIFKHKSAVPRLLDMLESTRVDRVANELVKALGKIGDKRAFQVLLAVTQRGFSESVRKNALLAIRNLKW